MRVLCENSEDLITNLREQIKPLEVSRQKERSSGGRAEIRSRVQNMELLDRRSSLRKINLALAILIKEQKRNDPQDYRRLNGRTLPARMLPP